MSKREASIKRKTNETDIELSLNIDGTGICKIETGKYKGWVKKKSLWGNP